MAVEFKPFRQIPHDYHYEGPINPNSVKPGDTVLLSIAEKEIISNPLLLQAVENGTRLPTHDVLADVKAVWFTNRYLQANNSSERKARLADIKQFCDMEYPNNYQALRSSIEWLSGRLNSTHQLIYKVLQEDLDREYKPPEFLRLHFVFQDHTVKPGQEFGEKKTELIGDMRGFFRPGERNVIILEDSSGTGRIPQFVKCLQKYGRPYMALAYLVAKNRMTGEPTDEQVKSFLPSVYSVFQGQQTAYLKSTFDVLEELYDEDKIGIEYERGSRDMISTRIPLDASFTDYRKTILTMNRKANSRNAVIVNQLRNIEKTSNSDGIPTNVFVLLGTNHERLLTMLPHRLRVVSSSMTRDKELPNKAEQELAERFRRGEPINDDLWAAAYSEFAKKKLVPRV